MVELGFVKILFVRSILYWCCLVYLYMFWGVGGIVNTVVCILNKKVFPISRSQIGLNMKPLVAMCGHDFHYGIRCLYLVEKLYNNPITLTIRQFVLTCIYFSQHHLTDRKPKKVYSINYMIDLYCSWPWYTRIAIARGKVSSSSSLRLVGVSKLGAYV